MQHYATLCNFMQLSLLNKLILSLFEFNGLFINDLNSVDYFYVVKT